MPRKLLNEADRLGVRITFNMTEKDHAELLRIAEKQRIPFGQILRALVRNYLKQTGK